MWYLTSDSDQRVLYLCPQKREVIIGRSPDQQICDFPIQDDSSISRKHAILCLRENGLFIKDLGSRYGTFINSSQPLAEHQNTKLQNSDVIKFGKINCTWKVHEASLVTCTSTLKGENLQNLKLVLAKLGGELKNDWDDTCEYLTMPAITLTIKVVLALVQASNIVSVQFWEKCLEAVNAFKPLPHPKDYKPDILESTLNKEVVSFLPDKRRSSLFAGKKFIFFSKRQFEMYKAVLIKGLATPLLLSESKLSKSMLCNDDVVVIQYNFTSSSQETEAQRNQITDIVNYLKSNGKRVVADPEIGLAVLHCSSNKYCNPSFNFSTEVIKQAPAQQNNKVLAPESQEQSGNSNKKDNVIIDETLVSNDGNTSKRKLSDIGDGDDFFTNASKKRTVETAITSNEPNKRKHEGDESSLNPSKKMALDDDDMFNFVTPANSSTSTGTDKLNLTKPQKRKAESGSNEDDLFNFVQNDKDDDNSEEGLFKKSRKEAKTPSAKVTITPEEISAMRGSKLAELNANLDWNTDCKPKIKKEKDLSLDEQMSELDLGEVIVTVKDSLIIKKEPIEISEEETSSLKNFKKFKKVWPLKKQITVISKSSMTVTNGMEDFNASLTNQTA